MIHTSTRNDDVGPVSSSITADGPDSTVTIPDTELLFSADYKRTGLDLILSSHDGRRFVVHDYFKWDKHPTLVSGDGARLAGDLVDLLAGPEHPGVYAQADFTPTPGPAPIGKVEAVSGSASAIRGGVAVQLNLGDVVFQNDVIQTGSDSSIGFALVDGSAFRMTANARMVLNELVYDPNGNANSALVNLVQGSISFVAGQVAHTGDMKVQTPVATMGIRGTAVNVNVTLGVGNNTTSVTLSMMDNGVANIYGPTGQLIGTLTNDGTSLLLRPVGINVDISHVPMDNAVNNALLQDLGQILQNYTNNPINFQSTPQTPNPDSNPRGDNSTHSQIGVSTPLQQLLTTLQNQIGVTQPDIKIVDATTHSTEIVTVAITSTNTLTFTPTVVTPPGFSGTNTASVTELAQTTGAAAPDTVQGTLTLTGNPPDAAPAVTLASAIWSGGGDIPGSLVSNAEAIVQANLPTDTLLNALQATLNGNTVSLAFTLPDKDLDFLAQGETLQITYDINLHNAGGNATQTVTITVTGTNDLPVISIGSGNSAAGSITELPNTTGNSTTDTSSGTLTFTDVDLNDTHTVAVSAPSAVWSSGTNIPAATLNDLASALVASIGSDSTGKDTGTIDWNFNLLDKDFDFLAVGETLTVTYVVTVSDPFGGQSSQPITITITGTNDQPVIAPHETVTRLANSAALNDFGPSISADGNFIAYDGSDQLPVPGGQQGTVGHVYFYNRVTNTTTQIDSPQIDPTASPHQGEQYTGVSISFDGRFAVFQGDYQVPNQSGSGTHTESEVFIFDRDDHSAGSNGTTTLLADPTTHAAIQGGNAKISADGQFIVMEHGDSHSQLLIVDRNGTIVTTLSASDSNSDKRHIFDPAISADGNTIAFYATAANVSDGNSVHSGQSGALELYSYNRPTGSITAIATLANAGSSDANLNLSPSLSSGGDRIAFASDIDPTTGLANPIDPATGLPRSEVYVATLDQATHTFSFTLVSKNGNVAANGASFGPQISPDGDYITFSSTATNLAPGASSGQAQTYLYNLLTNAIQLVSTAADGTVGNGNSAYLVSVTGAGVGIAFGSTATNLVAGDTNGKSDVFGVDLSGGTHAAVTEDVNLDINLDRNSDPNTWPQLKTFGAIAFSDVDLNDHHTVSVTPSTSSAPQLGVEGQPRGAAIGTFTASVSTDTTGAGAGGVISWNYSISESAAEAALNTAYPASAAFKSLDETFRVTISDGQGGTSTQIVTVTIVGTQPLVAEPIFWIGSATQPDHGGDFKTALSWSSDSVPASTDDVGLIDLSGNYKVTSKDPETVHTLATIKGTTLEVVASDFTITSGTGIGGNAGTIQVDNGAMLGLGGTVVNSGAITLNATTATTTLVGLDGVTLQGGGSLTLSDSSFNTIVSNGTMTAFTNVDNTISGAGTIGDTNLTLFNQHAGIVNANGTTALVFDMESPLGANNSIPTNAVVLNAGEIEATGSGGLTIKNTTIVNTNDANNFGTVDNPVPATGRVDVAAGSVLYLQSGAIEHGTVTTAAAILNGAPAGEIDTVSVTDNTINTANGGDNSGHLNNAGKIVIKDNSSLTLISGNNINNSGSIRLESTGHQTTLYFNQPSPVLSGGGTVTLVDDNDPENPSQNLIAGITGQSFTTVNLDNQDTISGSGTIGTADGKLTLQNDGTVDANVNGAMLVLHTGSTITNAGTLEATNGGTLVIDDAVTNTGTFEVGAGSFVTVNTVTITDSGHTIMIDGAGTNGTPSAGTMTLNGAKIIGGTINNYSLDASGNIVAGDIDVTGDSKIAGDSNGDAGLNRGGVTIASGAILSLDNVTVTGTTFNDTASGATIAIDGGDSLTLSGVTIHGGTTNNYSLDASGNIVAGDIDVTSNSTIDQGASLNSGDVHVGQATLTLDNVTVTGTAITETTTGSVIQVDATDTLTLAGTDSITGIAGSKLGDAGEIDITGTATVSDVGVTNQHAIEVKAGGALTLDQGTAVGNNGGTITVDGATTNPAAAAATLTLNGASIGHGGVNVDGVLDSTGTSAITNAAVTDTGNVNINSGTLNLTGTTVNASISDNFSPPSALWSNLTGNWTASNGQYLAQVPNNVPPAFTALPYDFSNSNLSITVTVNQLGDGGIWIDSDGTNQEGVVLVLGGFNYGQGSRPDQQEPRPGTSAYWSIVKNGSSSADNLVSGVFTPGHTYTITVIVNGDIYSAYKDPDGVYDSNSIPLTTLVDDSFSHGAVGLYDDQPNMAAGGFGPPTSFSNFSVTQTSGLTTIAGGATLALSGSTINATTINGTDATTGGIVASDIDVTGNSKISATSLDHGDVTVASGVTLTLDNDIVTGVVFADMATGATIAIDPNDMLTLSGVTIHGGTINDDATIAITGDSKIDQNAGLNNGNITIAANTTLTLDNVTVTGTHFDDMATGATIPLIQIDDIVTLQDGATVTGGAMTIGTVANSATLQIDNSNGGVGATLDHVAVDNTYGTINVDYSGGSTVTLVLADGTTVTGGQLNVSRGGLGQVEITAGQKANGATFDDVSVDNSSGTINIDASGTLLIDDGTTITSGAINVGADAILDVNSATGAILDSVTVVNGSGNPPGDGTVQVEASSVLTLTGGGDIDGGDITLLGSGPTAGKIDVTGDSTIDGDADVSGGKITVEGGTTLTLDHVTISSSAIDAGSGGVGSNHSITAISVPGTNSFAPSMSGDGRFIAFGTSTVLPGQSGQAMATVQLYDTTNHQLTDLTTLVPAGDLHGGETFDGLTSISTDGRYVIFTGKYTDPNNGSPSSDIFLYDSHSPSTVTLVKDHVGSANISDDGTTIVSEGNTLGISGVVSYGVHILVMDKTGTVQTEITGNSDQGQQPPNGGSPFGAVDSAYNPAVSSDGRFVSFWSTAPQINIFNGQSNTATFDTGNTGGTGQVYVYDHQANTLQMVSVNDQGQQGNFNSGTLSLSDDSNNWASSLSADGRYVVFQSDASNLVSGAGDANGDVSNIFVYDTQMHTVQLVSGGLNGAAANGSSMRPQISANGRYVTFASSASNLVAGDTNGKSDTFIYDTLTHTTTLVSTAANGALGDDDSSLASAISADGSIVAFGSAADNLVPNDTDGKADIFVVDLNTKPPGALDITGDTTINDNASLTGGAVTVESSATLTIDTVTVSGTTTTDDHAIVIDHTVKLTDGTTIQGSAGSHITNDGTLEISGTGSSATLKNEMVTNDVVTNSGAMVQVDDGDTLYLNGSTIHAGTIKDDGTIVVAGSDTIDSSAEIDGGEIDVVNGAILTLDDVTISTGTVTNVEVGGALKLADTVTNEGTINLDADPAGGDPDLEISGTVTLNGGGYVFLLGNDSTTDRIIAAGPNAELINVDNTISGSGTIGQGDTTPLTLVNQSGGTIKSTGDLVINTGTANGTTTTTNAGHIEAVGADSVLVIQSTNVDNSGGTIAAINDANVPLDHLARVVLDGATIKSGTVSTTFGTIEDESSSVFDTVTNTGFVEVDANTYLDLRNSLVNSGKIQLFGTNAQLAIDGAPFLLSGTGGQIEMAASTSTIAAIAAGVTLENETNTIYGAGTIGGAATGFANADLTLKNDAGGTIEASGGKLTIETGNSITNSGTLEANGGTLAIDATPVTNTGTLKATANSPLILNGASGTETVTNYTGSGLNLVNGTVQVDAVDSTHFSTLDLETATIAGGIVSVAGLLDATGTSAITNAAITNTGTIEATAGTLTIDPGSITNSGMLEANGGNLIVETALTGNVQILGTSMLELGASSSSSENITLTSGSVGTLKLDHSETFAEIIQGLDDTKLDLGDITSGTNTTITYSGNSSSGTLTILNNTDPTQVAHIHLTGNYLGSGWTPTSDSNGGTTVTEAPGAIAGLDSNGNAVQGTQLTVSITDGGLDVTGASYQWFRDGAAIGTLTSDPTYTPTEQDEGHALTVQVSFDDAIGRHDTGIVLAGTVQESASNDLAVTLGSPTAAQGAPISVTAVSDGGTDVLSSATYEWQVFDTVQNKWVDGSGNGGNTATYTPSEGDEGKSLQVGVTYTDQPTGNTEITTTTAGTVQESASNDLAVTLGSPTAAQGAPISVTAVTDGGTDVLSSATYEWQVFDTVQNKWVDGSGNGGTTATYTPSEGDEGKSLQVVVTYTDQPTGNTEITTTTAGTVQESASNDLAVTLGSPTAAQGAPISVTAVTDGGTDVLSSATYEWQVFDTVQNKWVDGSGNGGTTATYTPSEGDEGKSLQVVVTYTDQPTGNTEITTTTAGTVQESASNDLAVTLGSPTAAQGAPISVTAVTDGGTDVLSSATYEWQVFDTVQNKWVDGSGNGGTTATYTPSEGDEGKSLQVGVTYTDQPTGNTEITTTTAGTVQESASNDLAVTLGSPTAAQGAPISVTAVTDGGTDVLSSATYEWQVFDTVQNKWVDGSGNGGTTATYTPSEGDEGKSLQVVVTYTDQPTGNTEITTTTAGTVQESASNDLAVTLGSPTAAQGAPISVTAVTDGGTDVLSSATYEWQVFDTVQNKWVDGSGNGGNTATYTPSEGDEGKSLQVGVTYTDQPTGNTEITTTTAGTVQESASNDLAVTLGSPTAAQGAPISVTAVTDGGTDVLSSATYEWQVFDTVQNKWVDGSGNGGTTATYTPSEGDEGKSLQVVVTYTDQPTGNTEITTTTAGTVVDNSSLSITMSLVSAHSVQEGQTLAASATILGDSDDTTKPITYQWQSSSDGTNWNPVGATTSGLFSSVPSSFYQLGQNDEGNLIRVQASFTDDTGQVVTATSAPTATRVADITPIVTVPFSYAVDEFKIVKGSSTFDDNFTQGPPPVGGLFGTTLDAFATNGSVWTEVNGKAIMSSSGAVAISGFDGVGAQLQTNTDPQGTGSGQSNSGLKENQTFTVSTKFDLTVPSQSGSGYGIELTNWTPTQSNTEEVQLFVQSSNSGGAMVDFYQTNISTATFTLIASQVLTGAQLANNNQIELDLAHTTANSSAITGSFELLNNGTQTSTQTFGATGHVFDGQTYTRADVFSFAPASVTISGLAQEGHTLTANAATNDSDATIHYQWQSSSNGTNWNNIGSDSSTYLVQESDEGFQIQVVASTSDSNNGDTASSTSAATVRVSDLVVKLSGLSGPGGNSGSPTEGHAVNVVSVKDDGTTVTSGLTYQWELNNNPIVGQTTASYTPVETDEGKQLSVVVTDTADGNDTITQFAGTVTDLVVTLSGLSGPGGNFGTPTEGHAVNVVSVTDDGTTVTSGLTYQWELNNNPIVGQTTASYTPVETDEGKQLSVVVTDTADGNDTITQFAGTVTDLVVTLSGLTGPGGNFGTPIPGQAVSVATVTDDGTTVTSGLTYQWELNNNPIVGQTTASYTPVETDEGKQLSVVVTDTADGNDTITQFAGTVTDLVVTLSGLTGPGGNFGTPIPGQAVSVATVTDDGTTVTSGLTYQWELNNNPIVGQTTASYTPVETDEGKQLSVVVTDTADGNDTITQFAGTVTDLVVTLSGLTGPGGNFGTPIPGQAVSVATVTDDGTTVTSGLTYQWELNNNPIVGQTTTSYTPVETDEGKQLSVVVTDTADGNDTITQFAGTVTDLVVTLSGLTGPGGNFGTPTEGHAVNVVSVTDDGTTVTSGLTYQWELNNNPIVGQTTASYTPVETDEGKQLSVLVTYPADGNDTTTQFAGSVTDLVVTLSGLSNGSFGSASDGQTVSVATVTDDGTTVALSGAGLTFQWELDNVAIVGATGSSYTPAESDEGHQLSLIVTDTADGNDTVTPFVGIVAAIDNWTKGADGDWSNAANWSNGVPASDDQAAIQVSGAYTVTSSGNVTVNGLTSTANATLSIAGGTFTVTNFGVQGPLAVSGGTLNIVSSTDTVASLTQTGGTLTGTGTLTVSGAAEFKGGGTESGSGTTIVDGSATFDGVNDLFTFSGRTLELFGSSAVTVQGDTIYLNNAAALVIESGASFTDEAPFNGFTIDHNSGTAGSVTNLGTFSKTGATAVSNIKVGFSTTNGTVNVQSGTLNLAGGGTDVGASYTGTGTIQFGGGTRTLDANSSISSNATFSGGSTTDLGTYSALSTSVSGGTADLAGTVSGLGAVSVSGGTLNLESASTTASSLTQTGGTLTGTGTLTVSGAAEFKGGGTESGSGTTIVDGSATFDGVNDLFTFSGRTLELFGSSAVTVQGDTIYLNNAAALVIESGASFTDEAPFNGFTIDHNSGTAGSVTNLGTFSKTGATAVSNIKVGFSTTNGTVNVQSGTLNLAGGGTDVGASYTGTGTIQFGGGTRTLDANSSISSNATFSGGSTTDLGTYSALSTSVSGGTADLAGTVSGLGAVSVSGGTLNLESASTTASSLTQTGGTLTGTGTLTVSGAAEFKGGGTESGSGTTIVDGSATFDGVNDLFTFSGRTLELFGSSAVTVQGDTIYLNNAAALVIESGASFTDEAPFNGFTIDHNSGTAGSVTNLGTFSKTGATAVSNIKVGFSTTNGTVNVQSGTLNLAGGGTDVGASYTGTGTIQFGGGTRTLDANSSISSNATFSGGSTTDLGTYSALSTSVSGGTADLAGTVSGLGAVSVSGGTLNLESASTTASSLTQTGGTLTGTGTLTVSGAAEFKGGGTESGSGTTIVDGSATFDGVNDLFTFSGRTLELFGSSAVTVQGDTIYLNNAAALVIESGASFTDEAPFNGFTIDHNSGTAGSVTNLGTFSKTGATTVSTINVAFTNSGTIDIQTGTLNFAAGLTNFGLVYIESGTTLEINGVSNAFTINNGGELELGGSSAEQVTFASANTGTLKLDQASGFSGKVFGLSGAGDVFDLAGFDAPHTTATPGSYNSGNNTTTLAVSDDQGHSASITLAGNYSQDAFVASSDGSSGADVRLYVAPTAVADTLFIDQNAPATIGAALTLNDLNPDNNGLTITAVDNATHGTVALNGGDPIFTPTAGYTGTASFTYYETNVSNPPAPGTLQAATTYAAGSYDSMVAIGDLTGSGINDIAVVNSNFVSGGANPNTVSVLLGNGDGTFQTQATYATGTNPLGLAIANLNGHPDLVVSNYGDGTISVLLGNGSGTFQSQTTYTVGSQPYSVAAGDFGNGHQDIAVANAASGTVSVLLGDGTGALGTQHTYVAGTTPESVVVGDFNGDGKLDLAVADVAGTVSVLLGNGDGTFQAATPATTYATGSGSDFVAVGDLTGSGIQDLVVANSNTDTVSVLLGYGDGTFHSAVNYAAGPNATSVAIADLNDDGKLDLIVGDNGNNTDTFTVLMGNGDGTFQSPVTYDLSDPATRVAVADLNGDGRPDVVATEGFGNNVAVLLNDTAAPAADLTSTTVTLNVQSGTTVTGTSGNDTLVFSESNQTLIGNGGIDTFIYNFSSASTDTHDFANGGAVAVDALNITGASTAEHYYIESTADYTTRTGLSDTSGGNTVLSQGSTDLIDMTGIGTVTYNGSGANDTVEIGASVSQNIDVTSSAMTLKIDLPSTFTGTISGISGSGDVIDLGGFGAASTDSFQTSTSFSSASDATLLTVTDTTNHAVKSVTLVGNYTSANDVGWTATYDGSGGVSVVDPPATPSAPTNIVASQPNQTLTGTGGSDNFVFTPNFGNATITDYHPGTDTIQVDHTVASTVANLLASATQSGNDVVLTTDLQHDTITLKNLAVAAVQSHQSDFHIT